MAKEKFIRGKKDDADHVGLYHNKKQEQAADAHLLAWLNGEFDDVNSTDNGSARTSQQQRRQARLR